MRTKFQLLFLKVAYLKAQIREGEVFMQKPKSILKQTEDSLVSKKVISTQ